MKRSHPLGPDKDCKAIKQGNDQSSPKMQWNARSLRRFEDHERVSMATIWRAAEGIESMFESNVELRHAGQYQYPAAYAHHTTHKPMRLSVNER